MSSIDPKIMEMYVMQRTLGYLTARQVPLIKRPDIDSAFVERRARDHTLGYTTVGRVPVRIMNDEETLRALSFLEFRGGTVEQQQFIHDYEWSRGLMNSHVYLEEKKLVRIISGRGDDKYIVMNEDGRKLLTESKISAGVRKGTSLGSKA